MNSDKDSPSKIAKQTLTRLANGRIKPVPENYCRIYREVDGGEATWSSFCGYTKLLEDGMNALLGAWQETEALMEPETARIAGELRQLLTAASTEDDLKSVSAIGHNLALRMKRDLDSKAQLQAELVAVIRLVVADLGQLAEDDQWLRSQLQATEALLVEQASAADLVKARDILRLLLGRQREVHKAMAEAQQTLKAVMSELIRQAATLVEDTAGYETKMSELGAHIQAASDLPSIKSVVGELDLFVRDMGSSVRHSHQEMTTSHTRLVQAEQQIADLRKNLAETSEKVRRDALTGALNRSGLEEIWRREVARAREAGASLGVGMLDVDNFKQLNDRLGHTVGDEALVHLASVIRNALHGTDTMARYGGEEFVILLPDTDAAGAEALMKRLQRELTKHFFLHGNERLLITFSAGVTVVDLGKDTLISAVERADTALYEAKRLGKNRVVAA